MNIYVYIYIYIYLYIYIYTHIHVYKDIERYSIYNDRELRRRGEQHEIEQIFNSLDIHNNEEVGRVGKARNANVGLWGYMGMLPSGNCN